MNLENYLRATMTTATKFAEKVGVTKSHVSLLARRKRRPSPNLALRIERVTSGKVGRDELLFPELYATRRTENGRIITNTEDSEGFEG